MERTLVILKPDCVQRRLIGRIISRFEDKGLQVAGLKMLTIDRPLAERFYEEHKERSFFESLLKFMTSSPCVAVVVEGPLAISVVRRMLGPTSGPEAPAGTIRGDFALSTQMNLVHASDSPENALRERAIIFQDSELYDYRLTVGPWLVMSE